MNDLLQKQINIKARWVNKHYQSLSIPDLMQEAFALIATLKQKYGLGVPVPYLLAAIGYHFNNLMRLNKTERTLTFYDIDKFDNKENIKALQEFEAVENNIDRERFMKYIKNIDLLEVMNNLLIGASPEEIAIKKKCSVRQIYRNIQSLKRLREEWEK